MSESNKTKPDAEQTKPPGAAANYLLISAGSIFTSMLIAGFIVGYMLDQLFDTTPLFFLSCAVLGFIGGMQKVHQLTKRLDPPPKNKESEDDQKS
jgi:ATP synthase protein I